MAKKQAGTDANGIKDSVMEDRVFDSLQDAVASGKRYRWMWKVVFPRKTYWVACDSKHQALGLALVVAGIFAPPEGVEESEMAAIREELDVVEERIDVVEEKKDNARSGQRVRGLKRD